MKELFLVSFDHDLGELWLDETMKPIQHINANDANFRTEYHGFIFDQLDCKLRSIYISPSDKEYDDIQKRNAWGDKELFYKIFEKKILKGFLKK